MESMILPFGLFMGFLLLLVLVNSVKVVREYERLVVFRLGLLVGERGPGLIILIPGIERAVKV